MTESDTTPVLLIPGLACDPRMYAAQVAALGGRSVAVADHTRADDMATIAAGVLARAPARFALCGFSMGGYIALEIMATAPERVTRLALMDTQAGPESEEARAARRERMQLARAKGMRAAAESNLAQSIHPAHMADAALVQTIVDMAEAIGVEAFLRQAQAIIGRRDARPLLPRISVPTLVLVGDRDALTPPARAREMADAIAGASLVVVPESGHMTTLEQPQAVNAALLDFLG